MAANGSLFVLHLRLEGQILRDPDGLLRTCLEEYIAPHSYDSYYAALRVLLNLLAVGKAEYVQRWGALHDLLVFILRSTLYAQYADKGQPTFSMRRILERERSRELTAALDLRRATSPDFDRFVRSRRLAEHMLNTTAVNRFGTIEALITNYADSHPLMVAFGLRVLANEGFELTYDMFAFPPVLE
jgi:hypothetical protein